MKKIIFIGEILTFLSLLSIGSNLSYNKSKKKKIIKTQIKMIKLGQSIQTNNIICPNTLP